VAGRPLARPADVRVGLSGGPVAVSGAGTRETESNEELREELPRHVAIIMDGNRRWAREQGRTEIEGHAAGVDAMIRLLRHVRVRGIKVLSLYAFSRENWGRSDEEVTGLFTLLEAAIRAHVPELVEMDARLRLLGRLEELPEETQRSIGEALSATEACRSLELNIAFNYAGRSEIVDAVKRVLAAGTPPEAIDEAAIANALYTAGQPDPDLLIRTGGELRISNFLIWQSAYAELYSCPTLWPDFGAEAFDAALAEYASRTRRFGR
jgi:undecaprenyl diphosphate synthase